MTNGPTATGNWQTIWKASLSYPDVDDTSYASIMTAIVTSEMQIDNWRKSADEAVDDYMTYYYNYASCGGHADLQCPAADDRILCKTSCSWSWIRRIRSC